MSSERMISVPPERWRREALLLAQRNSELQSIIKALKLKIKRLKKEKEERHE